MPVAEVVQIRPNPVSQHERFSHSFVAARGDVWKYRDDDRAFGGFWSSSCRVKFPSESQMYDFFENGLGREYRAYGYGSRVLHEGMVYEMVLNVPPDKQTISLDSMFNEMLMRADTDGDGSTERSSTVTSTKSQARFGTKVRVLSGGQLDSSSVADQAVQTALDWASFPTPSIERGQGAGEPFIEIFSRGYIYMLSWDLYNQTVDTGTQSLSLQVEDLAGASDWVSAVRFNTNATTVTKEFDADRKILDILQSLTSLGDANTRRWVLYMTEGRVLNFYEAPPISVIT